MRGTGRAPLCTGMSKAPNHDACYHSVKARYATVRSLFLCPETLGLLPETFSSHSTRLYQSVFTPTTHSFSSQVLELRRQSPSVGRSTVSSRWWNTSQPFLLLLPPVLTYPYAPIPGHVRKTEAGKNLKRWKVRLACRCRQIELCIFIRTLTLSLLFLSIRQAEAWKNTRTGRACGNSKDSGEYCRPSKRVSSKTPKMRPKNASANKARKARGLRAKRAT